MRPEHRQGTEKQCTAVQAQALYRYRFRGVPQPAAEHFFTLTPCSLRLISPSEACQLTVFSISLAQVKSSNSGGQVCVVQYVKSAVTIGSWTTLDSRMVMLVFNGACVTNPL